MAIDGIQAAVSALRVNQRRVNQTAHNLANASTPGFTPSRVDQAEQAGGGVAATGTTALAGGPLVPTGRPLDLGLDGGGFFVLDDGNGGQVYTRAGSFLLDAEGNLVDPMGRQVEPGINVPPEATSVHVTPEGVVQALSADGEVLAQGQLETAVFGNPGGLAAVGGNAFQATAASGPPVNAAPGTAGHGNVVAGSIQGSGTDIASSMVNLILDLRAFEANTKTIQTYDDMVGTVLDIKS